MSTSEKDILFQKQNGTNKEILYPITRKENVIGFENDELAKIVDTLIQNKIDENNKKKYYVGCLIMDTKNINPSTYLGFGTWELWGNGKVPVGVDPNDTDFNTVEKIGGNKTHTLTVAEMPKHTHTFTGSEHTHSVPTHNHGLNSHTHSFSVTTGSNGSHSHNTEFGNTYGFQVYDRNNANVARFQIASGSAYHVIASKVPYLDGIKYAAYTDSQGSHTHSVSGTTGAASGSTANSSALTSGKTTQGGTNSNTGSGNAHSIVQPFITCYIWKRIS
ncbi:phage baseplate protein [uncultured Clostridium sp.]|uniref:phage baseplate protein n=1 Tax=uncultured Clostridium sp. TaxID=59620 RepID=UPI0026F18786|nr:hypothetical protein [uncultured Clostridium sp.]